MCALPIYSAVVTDDGEYLLVVSSEGTDERYGLTLHPIGKPGAQPITLVDDYANHWAYVTNAGTRSTFMSNHGAPSGPIVSFYLTKPGPTTASLGQNSGTFVRPTAGG